MYFRRRIFLTDFLSLLIVGVIVFTLSLIPSASAGPNPNASPDSMTLNVPNGGSVQTIDKADGARQYTLYRADGSLYATQERERGASLSFFYNQRGELTSGVDAIPVISDDYVPVPPSPVLDSFSGRVLHTSATRVKSSCGSDSRNPTTHKWTSTMRWWWKKGSTPSYLNLTNTLSGLRNAHGEWAGNNNWCGIADNSALSVNYEGVTTRSIGNDGVNVVDWGNVQAVSGCENPGWIACAKWWYNSSGTLVEADVRLDTGADWVNGAYSGHYDIYSAMAHEIGHQIGFGHVSNASNVMFPSVDDGNTSNRKLGRGDANANNAKY